MMNCSKCGTKLPDSAKFCTKCGTPSPEKQAISPAGGNTNVCPRCGSDNPAGAKFCRNDGTPLGNVLPESATLPASDAAQAVGTTQAPVSRSATTCPRCGIENPVGARFCKKDGTPLQGDGVDGKVQQGTVTTREPSRWGAKGEEPSGKAATGKKKGETSKIYAGLKKLTAESITRPSGKRSMRWIWLTLGVIFVLTCMTGGTLYYLGYIGMTSSQVEKTINKELAAKGFAVSVSVDRNWGAKMDGTVRDENERQSVLAVVKSNRHIKDVIDNVALPPDESKVKKIMAGVVHTAGSLKDAILALSARGQSKPGAPDHAAILKIYGIAVPDQYATYAVSPEGVVTAVIHNLTAELNGKTLTLSPDASLKAWKWGGQVDRRFLPENVDGETAQAAATPDTVKRTINTMLRKSGLLNVRIRVTKDMSGTLKGYVRNDSERQKALQIARSNQNLRDVTDYVKIGGPASPPQVVDPAKLEGEINRAIRKAGINGVVAQIDDAMVATLKGTVTSAQDREKAMGIAKSFKDLQGFKNVIFVIRVQ